MNARNLLVLTVAVAATAIGQRAPAAQTDPGAGALVRPAALEAEIGFWRRIYTEVTTSGGLIHDDRRLDIVYEEIDLPGDLGTSARRQRITAAKARYERILERLAQGAAELTPAEARVQQMWTGASPAQLREAAGRVRFQLGQADRFHEGLVRSGAWLEYIRQTLEREGLPVELAALPHVESSFNTYAYSKVGAAGMWQFMPGTGRRFLRIDNVIDERLDPYRSTQAAAQFLAQNYAVLGSWPLAITAYNHGPAGMRRARDQLGTADIVEIIRNYRSRTFGFASRNFYPAFLAAVEIDADPDRFFPEVRRNPVDASRVVVLPHYLSAASLSAALDTTPDALRRLNPSLLESVWNGSRHVPRGFAMRIPPHLDFTAALDRIPAEQRFAAQVPDTHHKVRRGDTLSQIASRYGVSVTRVAALNGLRAPYRIRAGDVLVLPDGAPASAEPLPEEPPVQTVALVEARRPPTEAAVAEVPVSSGDGADEPVVVAPAVETTVAAEAFEAADLGPALVEGVASASTADPADYSVAADGSIRVEAAETLGHYAEWLGIRAQRLRELNGMRYGELLKIGQRLELDYSRVSRQQFSERRVAYHHDLQAAYFAARQIAGSEVHTVQAGESVWVLSQRRFSVPLWLLRQYNPDVDLAELRPGTRLVIPVVRDVDAESAT